MASPGPLIFFFFDHCIKRARKSCINQHDTFESVLHDPDIMALIE